MKKTEKGVALMMVLWIIVFMSIISLNFLSSTRWVSASTHNLNEETKAYYLAMSAYQEAISHISSDKDLSVDFIDEEGNFRLDMETPPITGKRDNGDTEIEIRITDENARVNINFAGQDRLQKLCEQAGVKRDEVTVIVDSILDWRDADKEHHLSGVEDEYYSGLPEPYKAKNTVFDVPEELMLVKGMKQEYLYGSGQEGGGGMISLITTFGRNSVNINTVRREVMQFLGLNDVEIETILKQRNAAYGGFRFVPQPFTVLGLNAVATQNFRIDVTARMKNSPIVIHVTGVLNRESSPEGSKLKTIYWRERAETYRA